MINMINRAYLVALMKQLGCCFYNNFMSENRPVRAKNENMKTQSALGGKLAELEFGKPVKLPFIRKISTNSQQPPLPRRSLETKQTRAMRNSNKDLQLLDQTQLNLLTLQEIELCNEKNREQALPRITITNNPLFHRERSIDSLDHTKIRHEKSMSKIELSDHLQNYKLGPILGRGTYSIVRVARNREGRKFAIKTYLRSSISNEDRRNNLEMQVQILSSIQHESILGYQETIQTQQSINIVTELFDNRSLAEYLKTDCLKCVPEQQARLLMLPVVKAIGYLHGRDIVHRDLKLQNILVSKDLKTKVIDFGFSRQLPKENYILYDFCGTPHYIAPEVIQREGYYGKPADIWSLGVVLYRLTVGTFPFKGINQKTLFNKVIKAELKFPSDISQTLATLMTKMLSFDFRKRPTIEELLASDWVNFQN